MKKQEKEKKSDEEEERQAFPEAVYSSGEEWVREYEEQFGTEPGFF